MSVSAGYRKLLSQIGGPRSSSVEVPHADASRALPGLGVSDGPPPTATSCVRRRQVACAATHADAHEPCRMRPLQTCGSHYCCPRCFSAILSSLKIPGQGAIGSPALLRCSAASARPARSARRRGNATDSIEVLQWRIDNGRHTNRARWKPLSSTSRHGDGADAHLPTSCPGVWRAWLFGTAHRLLVWQAHPPGGPNQVSASRAAVPCGLLARGAGSFTAALALTAAYTYARIISCWLIHALLRATPTS